MKSKIYIIKILKDKISSDVWHQLFIEKTFKAKLIEIKPQGQIFKVILDELEQKKIEKAYYYIYKRELKCKNGLFVHQDSAKIIQKVITKKQKLIKLINL